MDFVRIGKQKVGPGHPCLIVGEVAQAHDGSLGMAHAFIDAIADAGANVVKFQTHVASGESSTLEPFRVRFSKQDETRYDYWKRMEFTADQWVGLAEHAHQRKMIFLSSPFSEEAVDILIQAGVTAWKIASGEINNPILMERIAVTKQPVILSTGMSTFAEIDQAVADLRSRSLPFILLQCTSKYPSPPEETGLNVLKLFQDRYQVPIGLSDHSGTIFPGLAAVTMGANLIEVHVTLSRQMFGPDVPVSLTPDELHQLVEGTRFIEKALASPVSKDEVADNMYTMRTTFNKSLVARIALQKGHVLTITDLTDRKPGAGIPVQRRDEIIGRILKRNMTAGEFLKESDLD